MTAPKNVRIFGARANLQTAPGTPIALLNTNGVLLAEAADVAIGYAHDGSRSAASATMGNQKRVGPSGRTAEYTLKCEPRGAGAPYSSSVGPNILTLARLCGLDVAIVTTGGTESYTFTPSPGPTGFGIGSIDLFGRGQQYTTTEAYGDFTLGATGPTVPMAEFAIKSLLPTIADLAVPPAALITALSALGAILPPKAVNLGFAFGGVTGLVMKKWSLRLARTINPRSNQNSGGHQGYAVGGRVPVFDFTCENAALSTIDFYALRDAGTESTIALTCGSVQYNRHKVNAPAAQVIDVKDGAEDPAATIDVSCQLNPSAFGLNDEFAWKFD